MGKLKLILFFLPLISYSQQLKTYSGEYRLNDNHYRDIGKATYKYYENKNSERVKEGHFFFQGRKVKIEGQFKNGLRNGLWKFTVTDRFRENSRIPSTMVVSVQYISGKLNGKCTFVNSASLSKKILESSTAFFKENLLIGDYIYTRYPVWEHEKKLSIKFTQDSLGRLNGEYRAEFYNSSFGNIEDVVKYENGTMTYRLCREKIDGKVLYRYENGIYTKEIEHYRRDILSSTPGVQVGTDFWIPRQDNPIYSTKEGIDESGFILFNERNNLDGN